MSAPRGAGLGAQPLEPARRPSLVRRRAAQRDTITWLASRGWRPIPFQRAVWKAMGDGTSGLLHASTGAGKTLAVWLGALQLLTESTDRDRASTKASTAPGLRVLWLTPMRA
ncbi:MAG: DEAD/DEAH box helicase, partial [Burkholderiaceae bacterium]